MQYITGLQVVMSSIAKAIGPLANIALLLLFAVIIFAIVGLEFYSGALNRTCYSLDDLGKKYTCTYYIVKVVPPIRRNESVINRSHIPKRATAVLLTFLLSENPFLSSLRLSQNQKYSRQTFFHLSIKHSSTVLKSKILLY